MEIRAVLFKQRKLLFKYSYQSPPLDMVKTCEQNCWRLASKNSLGRYVTMLSCRCSLL